ncbi:MAG: dipeptide epimerase, partial [Chloroflexota bacterium]|nr:dipeptide epimerase [Chloroflexota bacterium]
MELTAHTLDLTLATPFRISRSTQTRAHNVQTRIDADGVEGVGEAAPASFYGERRETVLVALSDFAEQITAEPGHIEDI